MVKFGLQFKATLENVTNVRPLGDDFRWFLKLKCGNCGEVPDKWQYVTLVESVPLKGGRGSASMVQKCKLCARENSIDILGETITPYNAGFAAQGAESGTQFPEINLQEKDWTDYDEKVRESVGIYEVTHQFIKC
ncbi:CXXC motif containing zinc binding protein isoform X2 [Siniperca chuatsi]|uniref:CXXC motif containing zinc binding protein isoform X2 n=1 Tax=Siniperca chuatsi TaxID=119488 RepID=UPI001CE08FB9|nr:CXXC motif containing zinc binding protein isoform X2 [Siniperca chuatsi]